MAKKKKKWIQAASASIKRRGTEGVCTGDKFGGPTCPPGSKRYNLAKVFKGMARKKKKAATGAMIKAKNSALISHQKAYDLAKAEKGEDRITKADIAYQRTKHLKGRISRNATGAMIKAKTGVSAPIIHSNIHPGVRTGYKSPGWVNRNLNKIKDMMKVGTKSTSMKVASKFKGADPSKFLSRAKTLSTGLSKRGLALAGGPIGLGMYAGTMGARHLVTKAFDPYRDKATGKISKKGHETLAAAARSREALMAKRNKARNAKTGKMVKAVSGNEVLGKDSVPFKSLGAHANLADERQGRKGAAVTGFNFKGVF